MTCVLSYLFSMPEINRTKPEFLGIDGLIPQVQLKYIFMYLVATLKYIYSLVPACKMTED